MQKVGDFVKNYFEVHKKHLENVYPGINPKILLKQFIHYSGKNENDIFLRDDLIFFESIESKRPLEYISSEKFFYRSPFYLNENVLIPRDETEILVEDSVAFISKLETKTIRIAEVGIGSFAIGLSILADLDFPVELWGGDISKEALAIANINYHRLKNKIYPKTKVEIAKSDRLKRAAGKFKLIVSNPPYIKESDLPTVHETVVATEPHVALFLPDAQYYGWFDDFFKEIASKLEDSGAFFMEGHEDTLLELAKVAQSYFTKATIKKDYTGRDRFLHCYL